MIGVRFLSFFHRAIEALAELPVLLLNALTSRHGYTVTRSASYGDLVRQTVDVYLPDKVAAESPLVVFIHGGAWDTGRKGLYRFVGQSFVSAGLIVAIPNYRLFPEVTFPAFVDDAAAAVAWAVRHFPAPGGQMRPLIVVGHSAGAHIAMLLVLDHQYLADTGLPASTITGAIGLSGPYDFLPLKEERYLRIFPEDLRAASQPINFAGGHAPPLLLIAGAVDRIVDPGNTVRLAQAVREEGGGEVTEIVHPGVGHLGTIAALAKVLPFRKPPVRGEILAFIGEVANRTKRD